MQKDVILIHWNVGFHKNPGMIKLQTRLVDHLKLQTELPENKVTSKTEYTNTQQDWSVLGYIVTPYVNMLGLERFWVFFCWKATKSMSLIPNFSFQVLVSLSILDLHLSIQAWYRNYLHPTRLSIILVSLLTLCGKEIKQSQYPWEAEKFELNFNPCKVSLTHMLGVPTSHSQETVCFSFRFMDRCHSPRLQRTALLCTRGLFCNIK